MTAILILCLEGVLQSWGLRARWDFRDSGAVPSKSGIIGLLSCAMGIPRGDKHIIWMDESLRMGVRVDRAGLVLNDFQTVTGERGFLFRSDGAKRVGEPTILTPRQYLQDAFFTVALQGDVELLRQCATALQAPVWQIFLGRKCCPPSRPVYETIVDHFDTLDQALTEYPLCNRHANKETFYCEVEDLRGSIQRQDALRQSGINYSMRRIRYFQASCIKG